MPQGARRNKNKKRDRRLGELKYDAEGKLIDDRNTEEGKNLNYKDIVRENKSFEKYYEAQNICPPDEFQSMIEALQSDLPASFRLTGCRSQARALLRIIEGDFFKELQEFQEQGGKVVIPNVLSGTRKRWPTSLMSPGKIC